ncbi:cation:proton antiporter [Vibrio sp. SS-MA-C1-2]|uniref:cation:proton antiporter family protein n=1 Tax=Vibrio sp. SS-MA-C1-2 TaxID=2908646 RepID=UPI001F1F6B8D|nr:cation:proton antiporter family protein [Vibrio sp. SS-MA-C1-2]UJF17494.1 cation:proton antiporter [Vibrio sp. SS-MA-C1-2]
MEVIIITAAFLSGFLALKCHLPPMVGFLFTGFGLHFFGYQTQPTITALADLGVLLLLFTIGLKLDIKTLLGKEIWLGSTLHNVATTLLFTFILYALKLTGMTSLAEMANRELIVLGFALSFSSTVFAVKTLQEKGEMNATFGTIAIGILVMQDIFAVLFLTASTGKVPEWYAIALFALPLLRPLFYRLLDKVGHGEMLVLFGIFMALVVGAGLFELVGMKPDLGALILGMLLAGHKKASELSKSLFNMKELFLVCFFLNIGLSVSLTVSGAVLAVLLLLMLPIKGVLYFFILNQFNFRVRTSFLASLTLFNYSEFGLIVGGLAYQLGWMPADILTAIALAVSLSFMISAPLNRLGHQFYQYSSQWLKETTMERLNQKDRLINPGDAKVLILGMGRIGTGAYKELHRQFGDTLLGVEVREEMTDKHKEEGRNVITADATDSDFWARILNTQNVKLVLLAMPHHQANQIALEQLKQKGFEGKVAAIAEYSDQIDGLLESGADAAFNLYNEAGTGFAQHVCDRLKLDLTPRSQKEES